MATKIEWCDLTINPTATATARRHNKEKDIPMTNKTSEQLERIERSLSKQLTSGSRDAVQGRTVTRFLLAEVHRLQGELATSNLCMGILADKLENMTNDTADSWLRWAAQQAEKE